jgi:hypothetical protein
MKNSATAVWRSAPYTGAGAAICPPSASAIASAARDGYSAADRSGATANNGKRSGSKSGSPANNDSQSPPRTGLAAVFCRESAPHTGFSVVFCRQSALRTGFSAVFCSRSAPFCRRRAVFCDESAASATLPAHNLTQRGAGTTASGNSCIDCSCGEILPPGFPLDASRTGWPHRREDWRVCSRDQKRKVLPT